MKFDFGDMVLLVFACLFTIGAGDTADLGKKFLSLALAILAVLFFVILALRYLNEKHQL